jgi:hypothetical protein
MLVRTSRSTYGAVIETHHIQYGIWFALVNIGGLKGGIGEFSSINLKYVEIRILAYEYAGNDGAIFLVVSLTRITLTIC